MTIQEIEKRVDEIRQIARDDEMAHSLEDALWDDVLSAIMEGAKGPAHLAKHALETKRIRFSRWCA